MTAVRLIFWPRAAGPPSRYLLVEDEHVVHTGEIPPGGPVPFPDTPAILVTPGEDVLCRWLDLPMGREAQAVAAAGLLLEDQLAAPRESLHIALGAREPDGRRLVVVVDRERMRAWLDGATAMGVSPYAVAPDCLMLPAPEGEEVVAARLPGDLYAVRGERLALTCEAELIPAFAPEHRLVETGADVDRLFAAGRAQVDLQQGPFAPKRAAAPRRMAPVAALLALVALSLLAIPAVTAIRHELAAKQAIARTESLAGPAPAGRNGADPAARLRARLDQLEAARRFPSSAAAMFAALESVEGMELESLVYGEDGALRASVSHPNHSDIEMLKSGLARAGLSVDESSATPQDGRILSDFIVRPRR